MLGLVADKRETLQQQLEDIQMVLLELEAAEQRCCIPAHSSELAAGEAAHRQQAQMKEEA
jgi:hypothetical protein